ncbi:MAG: hypothetical protein CMO80_19680 [Verrucomicrobiales bacterium]|nr:hypothetical protein [Verrucomicrobiales bacterium]|tara:strand:- start:456 stop:734 length:279 start_codon:yes stop_codon:yes gene_type:complete
MLIMRPVGPETGMSPGHVPCFVKRPNRLECIPMKASNSIVSERVRMIQRLRESTEMGSGFEHLEGEHIAFLKRFLLNSGSLKQMAAMDAVVH